MGVIIFNNRKSSQLLKLPALWLPWPAALDLESRWCYPPSKWQYNRVLSTLQTNLLTMIIHFVTTTIACILATLQYNDSLQTSQNKRVKPIMMGDDWYSHITVSRKISVNHIYPRLLLLVLLDSELAQSPKGILYSDKPLGGDYHRAITYQYGNSMTSMCKNGNG
jgi:hypothetical protein